MTVHFTQSYVENKNLEPIKGSHFRSAWERLKMTSMKDDAMGKLAEWESESEVENKSFNSY